MAIQKSCWLVGLFHHLLAVRIPVSVAYNCKCVSLKNNKEPWNDSYWAVTFSAVYVFGFLTRYRIMMNCAIVDFLVCICLLIWEKSIFSLDFMNFVFWWRAFWCKWLTEEQGRNLKNHFIGVCVHSCEGLEDRSVGLHPVNHMLHKASQLFVNCKYIVSVH